MREPAGERDFDAALGAPRGFVPGGALHGSVRPPVSKSIAQRALVLAALADGACELELGDADRASEDVAAALGAARALGAGVEAGERTIVRPAARGDEGGASAIDAGESGTLARLVTAVAGLSFDPPRAFEVRARGTLLGRTSAPLVEALRAAGVACDPGFAREDEVTSEAAASARGTWPLRVEAPAHLPAELVLRDPVSSQELSALWIALAGRRGERPVVRVEGEVPSASYLELTRGVLAAFGVDVATVSTGARGASTRVEGRLRAPESPRVERDASAGAVALAAAAVAGGEVVVEGVPAPSAPGDTGGSLQGDARCIELLSAFGCATSGDASRLRCSGPARRAARVDLGLTPDLAPPLAIVAAAVAQRTGEASILEGLGTLRGKESDRLGGLAVGLFEAGWSAEVRGDALVVGAPRTDASRSPVTLASAGDHRMAFAWALLGLLRPGVLVDGPGSVAKSWPSFWQDLARLGATPARSRER